MEETKVINLPDEMPDVYEKADGSLAVQYPSLCIATKGSFESDQAMWATWWLQKRYKKEDFNPKYTYLYEIIYPENRIVVDYGMREGLVLLACINTRTGLEDLDIYAEAQRLKLNAVKHFGKMSLDDAKSDVKGFDHNKEGYVLKYSNGLRVKLKGHEYLRVHRIATGMLGRNAMKHVFDILSSGQDIDLVTLNLPDDIKERLMFYVKQVREMYDDIVCRVNLAWSVLPTGEDVTRKKQAIWILCNFPDYKVPLFNRLDGKDYTGSIWKKVKEKI